MHSSILDMLMILKLQTTSMKAMLLGMQIQIHIHIRHQSHFLYVNAENEYSCLPLEAYNESNIWSMHNDHLIFIPFVIFFMFHQVVIPPVSCSSLFLDVSCRDPLSLSGKDLSLSGKAIIPDG